MKYCVLAFACAAAFAQSSTTNSVNGATATTVVSSDHTQTEMTQSIDGRQVPIEQSETRVLSKTANGSVTETVVRRYNRSGQLTSTERTVTDLETRPGGSTAKSTTYLTDLNGSVRETEHKTVDSETQGETTNTQTVVERPSIDGSFQAVEKRSALIENKSDSSHQDETVYRRNGTGGFDVAERKIADTARSGNKTTETTALYEPINNFSQLQLSRQQVSTTVAQPDGSETRQVDYYLPSLPGVARTGAGTQTLWEQDTVQRTKKADGAVVETVTARRADANRPNQLGPAETVSETVCRGNCSGK